MTIKYKPFAKFDVFISSECSPIERFIFCVKIFFPVKSLICNCPFSSLFVAKRKVASPSEIGLGYKLTSAILGIFFTSEISDVKNALLSEVMPPECELNGRTRQ